MTLEELIRITTIQTCERCGLKHALVRSCEEAKTKAEWDVSRCSN